MDDHIPVKNLNLRLGGHPKWKQQLIILNIIATIHDAFFYTSSSELNGL
jgi:hypothetical protein